MKKWYYKVDEKEFDAITEEELLLKIEKGELSDKTLIRNEEMSFFVKASSISGLLPLHNDKRIEQHRRLPLWGTIKEAFLVMMENASALLQTLAILAILIIALQLFFIPHEIWIFRLKNLLLFAIYIMFIITIHRIVLLGKESIYHYGIGWSKREWKYVLYSLAFYFLAVLFTLLLTPIALIVGSSNSGLLLVLTLIVPLLYFSARFSIVFPAIAVDTKEVNWNWIIDITKNNGFRLIVVLFLLPFIASLGITFFIGYSSIFLSIVTKILNMIVFIFEIILLSVSFKYLSSSEEEKNDEGISSTLL